MKTTFKGFILGALCIGFVWFAADGHRREQPIKVAPLQRIDRWSFECGVSATAVAAGRGVTFTNMDQLSAAAWLEWTNNLWERKLP